MKVLTVTLLSVFAITACSTKPPPPPDPTGDYRPINQSSYRPSDKSTPKVFDFKYKGSANGTLQALKTIHPQLLILPDNGKQKATWVDVDLRQVTLDQALFRIADTGKGFDLEYKSDPLTGVQSAQIRYK